MEQRNFKEAIINRRSIYNIGEKEIVSTDKIQAILDSAMLNVPSAFNSQTTRIVLLMGKHHDRLWDITKEELKKIVPADAFENTEKKIDGAFKAGYGSILFYEDLKVIKELEKSFPTYADRFYNWGQHTSAMHQFAVWTMLEDAGLGASLQHYNPIINKAIAKEWNINPNWELVAQMPFGNIIEKAGDKQFQPLTERLIVYK